MNNLDTIINNYISFEFGILTEFEYGSKYGPYNADRKWGYKSGGVILMANYNYVNTTQYCLWMNYDPYYSIRDVLGLSPERAKDEIIKWVLIHLKVKIDRVIIPLERQ